MYKKLAYLFSIIATVALVWHLFLTTPANIEPAAGQAAAAPPVGQPMPVSVKTLALEDVQLWHEFSGKLVAVDKVDIRPRVGGAIEKIYFEPGSLVKKGQPLFLVDPRPYRAEVNRQMAAVASAKAQAALAESEASRAQRLIKDNAISIREYDARANNLKVASASIQSAEAALQQASLNLNYATITSPIDGKVGRAEVTVGNLIDPAQGVVLTEIVSVNSIYADFEIDEQTYLQNIRKTGDATAIPVRLVISAADQVEYKGKIVSFDNKIDPSSGTIRVRAEFINHDGALVPGMFATVNIGSAEKAPSILISDRFVTTDQDKKVVYVVDKDNKVEYRPVKLGGIVNNMRVVETGLQAGDRIVVKGLQRVHPGMVVQPQEETENAGQ